MSPGAQTEVVEELEGQGQLRLLIGELPESPRVYLAVRRVESTSWVSLRFPSIFSSHLEEHPELAEHGVRDDWLRSGMTRRAEDGLGVGRWVLRAQAEGYEDHIREFEVRHGRQTSLRVDLHRE